MRAISLPVGARGAVGGRVAGDAVAAVTAGGAVEATVAADTTITAGFSGTVDADAALAAAVGRPGRATGSDRGPGAAAIAAAGSVDVAAAGKRRRGRPRDPDTQAALMSATRRLLARDGYDQLSIASVAEEAGVSRPTVYRRWPSKAHLVFDALFDAVAGDDPLSSSGDFDADLRRFVRAMFEWRRQPAMEGAGRDLLMALQRDLEGETGVEQLLSEQTLRTALQALVRDGVEQGVVSADVNAEMLFDTLVGTSVYLVHARRVDNLEHAADQLCSLLVQGVASRT